MKDQTSVQRGVKGHNTSPAAAATGEVPPSFLNPGAQLSILAKFCWIWTSQSARVWAGRDPKAQLIPTLSPFPGHLHLLHTLLFLLTRFASPSVAFQMNLSPTPQPPIRKDPAACGEEMVAVLTVIHDFSLKGGFPRLIQHLRPAGSPGRTCRAGQTHLKELLDDVIPKHIHHELIGCLQDLVEHQLTLCWGGTLQFQLNKPEKQPWSDATGTSVHSSPSQSLACAFQEPP